MANASPGTGMSPPPSPTLGKKNEASQSSSSTTTTTTSTPDPNITPPNQATPISPTQVGQQNESSVLSKGNANDSVSGNTNEEG